MKKLFIATFVLGLGFSANAQKEKETNQTPPDSLTQKANYNTTRSNKKSIAAPDDSKKGDKDKAKKVKAAATSKEGGKSVNKDFYMILERKRMK